MRQVISIRDNPISIAILVARLTLILEYSNKPRVKQL